MQTLTNTGTKNLLLHVNELADLYALKTLYDYLAQKRDDGSLDSRLFFEGSVGSERSREVLQNVPTREQFQDSSTDTVVSCYSDIARGGNLEIDISILKNCVAPMSDKDKSELKRKYGVNSQEPVVVIGYASPSSEVIKDIIKVVETASKYATVYLVGDGKKEDYHLSPEAKSKVHVVDKYGVLKDYYAMADVAINARNLRYSCWPLHNFVEATEGGPLFMVPSSNTAQYGYRQLANAGVIVECGDSDDLVGKVEGFLRNFDGNTRAINARARHLVQSRENYLPVFFAKIMQLIGEDTPLPDSDLDIIQNGMRVRIMHPDSNWGSIKPYKGMLSHEPPPIIPLPPITHFKETSYLDKFEDCQIPTNIIIGELIKSSQITPKKFSETYETIETWHSPPIPDEFKEYLEKPPFGKFNSVYLSGNHPQISENPQKNQKKQAGFPLGSEKDFSSLLAKNSSLFGNSENDST